MALKIGICLRFKNPAPWARPWDAVYREHVEYGRVAERLGFDGIWVPEHHCVDTGYNPAPFLALAALAHATTTCWLGTQPLLLPLHNPVLVAEEAAVLDVLSGGRLILGIGAGYRPGDFEALGEDRRQRGGRMDEGTVLLRQTLSSRAPFDFVGEHYRVRGVDIHPRPLQQPHPEIQLSARSGAAARRAGRLGLSVNLQGRDGVSLYGPIVVEEREKAGHGSSPARTSILRSGFLGNNRDAAIAAARDYLAGELQEYDGWQSDRPDPDDRRMVEARQAAGDRAFGLFTADDWLRAIEEDVALISGLGLCPDWINVGLWPAGMPLDEALACLEQFAQEVLPRIDRR